MSKAKFDRNKLQANIGTIDHVDHVDHVDHGKTTLTAALTKIGAERLGGEILASNNFWD